MLGISMWKKRALNLGIGDSYRGEMGSKGNGETEEMGSIIEK